jgi:hypothetical protein
MRLRGCTTREQVVQLILAVRTASEIVHAEQEIQRWISAHPEDRDYLMFAGESLQMVKTAEDI